MTKHFKTNFTRLLIYVEKEDKVKKKSHKKRQILIATEANAITFRGKQLMGTTN